MEIRLAVASDADAMVRFNQAMAKETEGKELHAPTLRAGVEAVFTDSSKGFYVVAAEGDEIVAGLMVTSEWSDWRNGWFWWIQSVYVVPGQRGKGVYGELYGFVKRLAADRGDICGFRLYVEKENERAQKVYEKLGMEETYYLMYEQMAEKP